MALMAFLSALITHISRPRKNRKNIRKEITGKVEICGIDRATSLYIMR
jgi:hypothetical protein